VHPGRPYNGFLADGLIYGLISGDVPFRVFFPCWVLIAEIYDAVTTSRRILHVRVIPAALASPAVPIPHRVGLTGAADPTSTMNPNPRGLYAMCNMAGWLVAARRVACSTLIRQLMAVGGRQAKAPGGNRVPLSPLGAS
jgi:hypothetical protein